MIFKAPKLTAPKLTGATTVKNMLIRGTWKAVAGSVIRGLFSIRIRVKRRPWS